MSKDLAPRLVKVEWYDAWNVSEETKLEAIKKIDLSPVISIGYLIDRNKRRIAIAPFVFPFAFDGNFECVGYRDTLFIPTKWIRNIYELKVGNKIR